MVKSSLTFLGDYDWKKGYVSGAVYNYNQKLVDLLTKVYGLASYTNPLHPDIFPGVCIMETEVVRMGATLFHGGPDACGTVFDVSLSIIFYVINTITFYGSIHS